MMHSVCVYVSSNKKISTKVLALFSEEKDMNEAEFPLVN